MATRSKVQTKSTPEVVTDAQLVSSLTVVQLKTLFEKVVYEKTRQLEQQVHLLKEKVQSLRESNVVLRQLLEVSVSSTIFKNPVENVHNLSTSSTEIGVNVVKDASIEEVTAKQATKNSNDKQN